MKLKQLLVAALLTVSAGASAQTDVTSTYLTNADFSQGPVISADIRGYGKDMVSGDVYGFQDVTGWTYVVTNADNSNASYPNSGMGGGMVAYGSTNQLKGNNVSAPAAGPDASSVNGLGFFAVWGCGGYYYQDVTFPAGKFKLTFPIYCISGTQANTTYTGFFPTSGTNRTVAINTTVGSWVNQTVEFTLTAETAGQIRIGYQSTGSGSGANPHLVFDGVKIEFTAAVVKDVLETALTAAKNANASLGTLTDAIATAQAVYDNADATQNEVNAAAATLNAAVELAMSAAGDATFLVPNLGFESCTVSTDNAAAGGSAAPRAIDGDWTQVSSAAWSSSAVVEYGGAGQVNGVSAPATDNLGNGGYTLGVSVGWGGAVTYKSASATFPAGVYTLKVNAYNALGGVTQFKSLFGFVPAEGSATLSTKTAFAYATWETDQVTFTLNDATEGFIQVGGQAISGGSGSNAKVFFDNITIEFKSFLAGAKEEYDEAVAAAEQAKTDSPNVTGEELTALNAELAKAEPTTVDGYNTATAAIQAATDAFVAAAPSYDALVAEIAYAKTIGVATETAEAALNDESTAANVVAATEALKVLEYTTITGAYANDVTTLLGTWDKGSYDTTSGQGYAGSETYFDKWNGSATDLTSSATVTLPAGKYVVKVAGRGVSTTTMSLSVKVGEVDAVSTPFLMNGDTGKGIDTDGVTNFSTEGSYSNSNTGRGWQYRYIAFTTDGTADVTIAINGHLNANTWQSFYAPVLLCDDDTYAPIAVDANKAELQAAIDNAPVAATVNVGDATFQLPTAGVTTYSQALTAAQEACDATDATVASLEAAKATLEAAIADYQALELNAPADGQLFNVVLTFAGWTYDQKAMTFIANGRTDAGNYNIQYKEAANPNLAQAFTFTKVEGNKYKMSQIDADGVVRYISTGVPYSGGNANQIRTVTEADKALLVEVIPTATEGVYNLRNTEANNYIGSQDAGVFTVNSHIDFALVETTKPSIAINTTAAGWGTVMLPFAVASLPTDVKAYTCAGANGQTLTLVEATALEANKPYIIEGAWNETLSGDAQGTALTYTEGLLTGVYDEQVVPAGKYVLQNQATNGVGFYEVGEGSTGKLKANRAYLNAPESASGIKAFFFGEGGEDAIHSVFSGIAAGEVYDLSGRKVASMHKGGVYVVGSKKVVVR